MQDEPRNFPSHTNLNDNTNNKINNDHRNTNKNFDYDENTRFRVPKKQNKQEERKVQSTNKNNDDNKNTPVVKTKKENFGFPLSFGRASEDFPLVDPNNIPKSGFSCINKAFNG